jgi:hypothetical protein
MTASLNEHPRPALMLGLVGWGWERGWPEVGVFVDRVMEISLPGFGWGGKDGGLRGEGYGNLRSPLADFLLVALLLVLPVLQLMKQPRATTSHVCRLSSFCMALRGFKTLETWMVQCVATNRRNKYGAVVDSAL